MSIRGISEVPLHLDSTTRRFLQDIRQNVVALREAQAPPNVPTNLVVTAEPFGNLVQWSRATNSDFSEVLWAASADITQAFVVPVSDAAQWVDHIGQVGITRFYWVRAAKNSGGRSAPAGPKSGTSLASTTGVNPPTPPPRDQGGGGGHQLR